MATNGEPVPESILASSVLEKESQRLRDLAHRLKERERTMAEMEANYPSYRRFVLAKIQEHFERTLPELPDKDLKQIAVDEQAQPLEKFIGELERLAEGQ